MMRFARRVLETRECIAVMYCTTSRKNGLQAWQDRIQISTSTSASDSRANTWSYSSKTGCRCAGDFQMGASLGSRLVQLLTDYPPGTRPLLLSLVWQAQDDSIHFRTSINMGVHT